VPGFGVAQLLGGAVAVVVVRALYPRVTRAPAGAQA
jgi:hypothetical protein